MSSLLEIKQLAERYPFSEDELEILLRGHRSLMDDSNQDSFLMKLAMCSPYSYFFLPGEELRDRIAFVENSVLPMGFPNELRSSIAADPFVNYANAHQDLSLERFLEGIADTGRRGPKEALRVIYRTIDEPKPEELVDQCFRMSIAAGVIVAPSIDKKSILARVNKAEDVIAPLVKGLKEVCGEESLSQKVFLQWAEDKVPVLASTLSSFVHNLLFHGHPMPVSRNPYEPPMMDTSSDIFTSNDSELLFSLSCASHHFGGKMHRLYSSEMDGRSFNRLEWSILGYSGPTLVVIRTEDEGATLGGFASTPWKDSKDFYGDSDCFIIQLEPVYHMYHPMGREDHFMYCHSQVRNGKRTDMRPHGLGFGGSDSKPRLFIPESLEDCSADFLDSTYESGDLLPKDAMEKFRIKFLEVWGVGGDGVIAQAMRHRAEYREATQSTILRARTVADKSQFAKDMTSGLIPNKVFDHREMARGRHDFVVDDKHGGYKVEQK